MGHQQIMLVLLGVLVVGIAIAVGVAMFRGNAIEQGRMALINDMLFIASRAREAYLKPAQLGGAQRNFSNITMRQLSTMAENDNGRYFIEGASTDELIIVGVGRMVAEGDTIRVRMRVNERTNVIEVLH
ncbi:MAG: hypothetical protein MUF82_06985 [Bacteroidetes bacterium]|nr:hypothetical protein [Bacteroidota bacterium]